MDIDYFERTMNQLYEATALAKGLDDAEKGNVHSGDDILKEMRVKYGL